MPAQAAGVEARVRLGAGKAYAGFGHFIQSSFLARGAARNDLACLGLRMAWYGICIGSSRPRTKGCVAGILEEADGTERGMNHTRWHGAEAKVAGLCTSELATRALAIVRPLLEAALADTTLGQSGYLHLVIMDPARPPGSADFEAAVLHEATFGEARGDAALYARLARAKARLSWRHGLDSHLLQTTRPQLLCRGDTTLWGGVALDGIVVAASGLEPSYDEALSGAVAMCLRGVLKAEAARGAAAGFTYE